MAPGVFPATHWPAADARSGSEDLAGAPALSGEPRVRVLQGLPFSFFLPGFTWIHSGQAVNHSKAFNKPLLG